MLTPVADIFVQATRCPLPSGPLPDEPFQAQPPQHSIDVSAVKGDTADVLDGAQLIAFDATGSRSPHVLMRAIGETRGAHCANHLEITLPPSISTSRVEVTLVDFAATARLVARNASGAVVASANTSAPPGQPETVVLRGPGITRIGIVPASNQMLLTGLCWEVGPPPVRPEARPGIGRLARRELGPA